MAQVQSLRPPRAASNQRTFPPPSHAAEPRNRAANSDNASPMRMPFPPPLQLCLPNVPLANCHREPQRNRLPAMKQSHRIAPAARQQPRHAPHIERRILRDQPPDPRPAAPMTARRESREQFVKIAEIHSLNLPPSAAKCKPRNNFQLPLPIPAFLCISKSSLYILKQLQAIPPINARPSCPSRQSLYWASRSWNSSDRSPA